MDGGQREFNAPCDRQAQMRTLQQTGGPFRILDLRTEQLQFEAGFGIEGIVQMGQIATLRIVERNIEPGSNGGPRRPLDTGVQPLVDPVFDGIAKVEGRDAARTHSDRHPLAVGSEVRSDRGPGRDKVEAPGMARKYQCIIGQGRQNEEKDSQEN